MLPNVSEKVVRIILSYVDYVNRQGLVQALKILILSQWFQPEPVFKGMPLAKALRSKGHDVEVLTGFPNYPGGRVYPGYRIRPWQRETDGRHRGPSGRPLSQP